MSIRNEIWILSRSIEQLVFHGRDKLIMQILWRRLRERHPTESSHLLRRKLTQALDDVVREEEGKLLEMRIIE